MPFGAEMNFTGVKELIRVVEKMPKEMRKGAYGRAMTKGGRVARKAARRNARKTKDTGALAKSIGLWVHPSGTYAKIGASRGYKQPAPEGRETSSGFIDPFNYAHLVELGTSHSAAQPYLRPAVDNNHNAILNAMAEGVRQGLDKETSKLERRIARGR